LAVLGAVFCSSFVLEKDQIVTAFMHFDDLA